MNITKAYLLLILLSLAHFGSYAQKERTQFSVMAWNILHGGNDIENGVDEVIGIIKAIDPDIILMIETYGSGPTIADSLGYHFHLVASPKTALDDPSINLSMYSKFPYGERINTDFPFYLGGREIIIDDQKLNFFVNWFHYLPWEDEPEKLGKSTEDLLAWEKSGKRDEMIQKVLPTISKYAAKTEEGPMIIGGDFNSYSHLDWTEKTASIHNGMVVPWHALRYLNDLKLIDSYRELNSSPITHPGITWDNPTRKDEHRIDYIFYKSPVLKALKSETYMSHLGTPFTFSEETYNYPSDHGIVVTTFELSK